MKDLQVPYADHFSSDETRCACGEDHCQVTDFQSPRQPIDTEFLDAVCNGVIIVGEDLKILSQNYVSKVNMGDLRGQSCFKVLENRDSPCENCPKTAVTYGDFETSMRCAGNTCSMYEARIYSLEDGTIAEVYPDMIDREILMKNMHTYSEELQLLKEVVENIHNAIRDDETVN